MRQLSGGTHREYLATLRRIAWAIVLNGRLMIAVLLAMIALTSRLSSQRVQIRHEILRGHIVAPDSTPLDSVEVVVTRAPDRAYKSAVSDRNGNYVIDWPDGTGDYLAHFSRIDRQTVRTRVLRSSDDSVLIVNAVLSTAAPQRLASMTVVASKAPRPSRTFASDQEVGSFETSSSNGVFGSVAANEAGKLDVLAQLTPGLVATPQGSSALGLPAEQNSTTLNGMAFVGTELPRNLKMEIRTTTSSYDPARGWFSGSLLDVRLAPGFIINHKTASASALPAGLRFGDPVAKQGGGAQSNVIIGGAADGTFPGDRWFYNGALDVSHVTRPTATLFDGSSDLLSHLGIAADSVRRLTKILAGLGVPTRAGEKTESDDRVILALRIDRSPYNRQSLTPSKSDLAFIVTSAVGRFSPVGQSPLTLLGEGSADRTTATVTAMTDYSFYFHDDYLARIRSGVSIDESQTDPGQSSPSGIVTLSSPTIDGGQTAAQVYFGGSRNLDGWRRRRLWETQAEVEARPSSHESHLVKASFDAKLDTYRRSDVQSTNGEFNYPSLDALQSNTPASFYRVLNTEIVSGGEWSGYGALSDSWAATTHLSIMGGARIEINRFVQVPPGSKAIDTTFGVQTAYAPSRVYVAPRLGFTWVVNDRGSSGYSNDIGNFNFWHVGYITGGVGEFRSAMAPTLLGGSGIANAGATGRPEILCIGNAVPVPDWSAVMSSSEAPAAECASGAGQLTYTGSDARFVDHSYESPSSWRANLAYASALSLVRFSLNAVYSLNLQQPNETDLNFSRTARFSLGDDRRPVFSLPTDIDPATGEINPAGSRLNSLFGRVSAIQSDLRSTSRQLSLQLAPVGQPWGWNAGVAYTITGVDAITDGFQSSTAQDPAVRYREAGVVPTQQIIASGGHMLGNAAFSFYGVIRSGNRFTPTVDRDINGDGLANDRAFIYDPTLATSGGLGTAIGTLARSAPSRIAQCLRRQFGSIAAPNSCTTPWTATLNMSLQMGRTLPGSSRPVTLRMDVTNALGGIDLILHGSNRLHGWGTAGIPSYDLYNVRAFDPVRRMFLYEVNSNFGTTRPGQTTSRAPLGITVTATVDLSRPYAEQQLDRALKPGRMTSGAKLTTAQLKTGYARVLPDPYRQLLLFTDSLLLSRDQVAQLQAAQSRYLTHMDSVWTDLATEFARLPDRYRSADALRRQEETIDGAAQFTRLDVRRVFDAVLSPAQCALLPNVPKGYYESRLSLHALRSGSPF